eukprot:gnl/MRDRNA2_/MRDRNA2_90959_c0_seq1.p1 gnl/MRDRNA2_/MRDRNA2_90959_c0~~gnl/MRDRNA2_/MRDRNA2_90959_c0_seq1.p1  ORF type:complete len:422 (+),score=97.24 gnl/MRDRNA2_/MRDRNA2_90959_c0_seq1:115-1380(+)
MPPKKEEAAAADEVEPQEQELPQEPEIHKKCFRVGGQVYYGECKLSGEGEAEEEGWVRHGYGKQVFSAATVTGETAILAEYEGYWVEDVIHGHGSYKWADGSSYEGNFADGQMNGYGRYQWPEGSCFSGMWSKNQMSGQGRFDSAFDGDFLQGTFRRNCFQQHNGMWLDVHREHRKAERLRIAEGEPRGINIVRCTTLEAFQQGLADTLAENFIPLVVADESFQGDPLSWVKPCDAATTVRLDQVALAKRRQHDYCSFFYDAIKEALLTNNWLTIVYDAVSEENPQTGTDDNVVTGPLSLPDEWRLEHFFEQKCLPLEVFDLKLFNGRRMSQFYLPEKGKEEAATESPPEPLEDQPTEIQNLRLMLVTLGRIAAEMSDSEVRAGIIARYGGHVPLHRTQIILLSEDMGYDQTGFDSTQRPY